MTQERLKEADILLMLLGNGEDSEVEDLMESEDDIEIMDSQGK